MELLYYPETDSLYIELRAAPSADTREIAEGVNVDFSPNGVVVGLDIDGASAAPTSPAWKPPNILSGRSRPRSAPVFRN